MKIVQLSSLEKVFFDSDITCADYKKASVLKGETFSYQIAYRIPGAPNRYETVDINIISDIKEYITAYTVGCVLSQYPAYSDENFYDDDYISLKPGLYPDVLYPLKEKNEIYREVWSSLWLEIKIPENIEAGNYEITVEFPVILSLREKINKMLAQ